MAALSFAAVSFYWGFGGVWGVDTLGGDIARLARARDPGLLALNWTAGGLKLAGGVLALALVQHWGRRLPRRPLILAARAGAILLTVYGLVQTVSVLLVHLGVVDLESPVPAEVIQWRLLLWEPWFLVWGLLLGATVWPNRVLSRQRGS